MDFEFVKRVVEEKMKKVPMPVYLIVGAFVLFVIIDLVK